jgi:hypothetical protein
MRSEMNSLAFDPRRRVGRYRWHRASLVLSRGTPGSIIPSCPTPGTQPGRPMSVSVDSPSPVPPSVRRRGRCLAAALLLFPAALAARVETPSPGAAEPPPLADSALRIGGIFNTSLPGTERRNELRLILHPRFGDLLNGDYLRIPFGLRYGITSRWEVNVESTAYVSHGISGNSFGDRAGLADLRVGSKVNLGRTLGAEWDTALGFDHIRPVGHPPIDITDGLQHNAPYVTFSRRLRSRPSVRVFWSVGVDLVGHSSTAGELLENQLGDDASLLTGGLVWDRGSMHVTLEANYGTTRLLGGVDRDVFTLRPGVVWELPARWSPRGRGRWLLGAGVRVTSGPDGEDFGASMKLRVDADLKDWWRGKMGLGRKSSRNSPR